ncbi:MAG: hypothetical protein CL946_00310 [Ectothiorhodospiraceae bacterium]|nr:hypothetical protein [Ectothiorhodospiraceae bacterium]
MTQNIKDLYPFSYTPAGAKGVRRAFDLLGLEFTNTEDKSLLYIGSRHGEAPLRLAKDFEGTILGIDEDTEGILYGKFAADALGYGKRVNFKVADPNKFRMVGAGYDYVVSDCMLTQQTASTLGAIFEFLNESGTLIIMEPSWLGEGVPTFVKDVWEIDDANIMNVEAWRKMLEQGGFTEIDTGNLSKQLEPFYKQFSEDMKGLANSGYEGMKHQKALAKAFKHEMDVYLRQGGRKWMGHLLVVGSRANNTKETP